MYTAALSSRDSLQNWTKGYSGGRNGADIIKKIRLCWERKNISQPASGSCNLNRLIVDLCLIFTKGKKNGEKRNQDRKWDTFRFYWSDSNRLIGLKTSPSAVFDWILEKRSPLTRNLALKKLAVLKLFAKLLYRYTTYISTSSSDLFGWAMRFYFLNMKVMNVVKNIKLWKVKKNQ